LQSASDPAVRRQHYRAVRQGLDVLLDAETDWIAALSTVACELHHAFEYFHWTGFYRVIAPELLAVGPYQGGHGCLRIPFSRGVCGAAAREQRSQLVADVTQRPDHIACSSTTRSEIVVPLVHEGSTIAVLDVDSDEISAFSSVDQAELEAICGDLCARFGAHQIAR
jgi:GAF domain-containing protein